MSLAEELARHLDELCLTHPDRHVGGPGNCAANELFARAAEEAGWQVERLPFDCVDWELGGAALEPDGERVELLVGPYSPPFDGAARLVPAESVEALESLGEEAAGCILFLHGEIAAEQITPRNYPFYQWDSHKRVLAAIDAVRPAAVLAATGRTQVAAAVYPFPMFEDAGFGYPSAYLKDIDAGLVLAREAREVRLRIDSRQLAARGEQVIARLGDGADSGRRVVISAHIDSRHGTPGALDNAASVCVLLGVVQELKQAPAGLAVELLPFNGEDNFAAYGEVAYLAKYGTSLANVALAINLDAAGRRGDKTAYSFYGASDEIKRLVADTAQRFATIEPGPEWPMSDHMVFAMRGVPAVALTSTGLFEIAAEVAHTAGDVPDLVDVALLVEAVEFVTELVGRVASEARPG